MVYAFHDFAFLKHFFTLFHLLIEIFRISQCHHRLAQLARPTVLPHLPVKTTIHLRVTTSSNSSRDLLLNPLLGKSLSSNSSRDLLLNPLLGKSLFSNSSRDLLLNRLLGKSSSSNSSRDLLLNRLLGKSSSSNSSRDLLSNRLLGTSLFTFYVITIILT
jgi:hypothetical protein